MDIYRGIDADGRSVSFVVGDVNLPLDAFTESLEKFSGNSVGEPAPGTVCSYVMPDYPFDIVIEESSFVEDSNDFIGDPHWDEGRAKEIIIDGQKAKRGQRLIRMSYEETGNCGGGYAGLGEMEEVHLSTPQDLYTIHWRVAPECRDYIEIFDKILSTFKFID